MLGSINPILLDFNRAFKYTFELIKQNFIIQRVCTTHLNVLAKQLMRGEDHAS